MTRSTQEDWQKYVNINLLGMKKESKREDYAFQVFTWYGDNKKIIADWVKSIKWRFVKVEAWSYDYTNERWEIKKSKTLTFFFDDWECIMKYGSWYNMISRQIIYNLASIEWEIWEIELKPYWSKKGYRGMWMLNNWNDVRSKFDFEKDIKAKCKYSEEFQKTSYVELDKWIDEELIPAINKKMENHPFEEIEVEHNFADTLKEKSKEESKDEIDDLPF